MNNSPISTAAATTTTTAASLPTVNNSNNSGLLDQSQPFSNSNSKTELFHNRAPSATTATALALSTAAASPLPSSSSSFTNVDFSTTQKSLPTDGEALKPLSLSQLTWKQQQQQRGHQPFNIHKPFAAVAVKTSVAQVVNATSTVPKPPPIAVSAAAAPPPQVNEQPNSFTLNSPGRRTSLPPTAAQFQWNRYIQTPPPSSALPTTASVAAAAAALNHHPSSIDSSLPVTPLKSLSSGSFLLNNKQLTTPQAPLWTPQGDHQYHYHQQRLAANLATPATASAGGAAAVVVPLVEAEEKKYLRPKKKRVFDYVESHAYNLTHQPPLTSVTPQQMQQMQQLQQQYLQQQQPQQQQQQCQLQQTQQDITTSSGGVGNHNGNDEELINIFDDLLNAANVNAKVEGKRFTEATKKKVKPSTTAVTSSSNNAAGSLKQPSSIEPQPSSCEYDDGQRMITISPQCVGELPPPAPAAAVVPTPPLVQNVTSYPGQFRTLETMTSDHFASQPPLPIEDIKPEVVAQEEAIDLKVVQQRLQPIKLVLPTSTVQKSEPSVLEPPPLKLVLPSQKPIAPREEELPIPVISSEPLPLPIPPPPPSTAGGSMASPTSSKGRLFFLC